MPFTRKRLTKEYWLTFCVLTLCIVMLGCYKANCKCNDCKHDNLTIAQER